MIVDHAQQPAIAESPAGEPVSHLSHTGTGPARLAPRLGASRLEFGVVTALDYAGRTATVLLLGASSNVIGPVPVSLPALPSLVLDSVVLVLLVDENTLADAIVIGAVSGSAPVSVRGGQMLFTMSGAAQSRAVTYDAPLPGAVLSAVASVSAAGYGAQVTASSASGLSVQCTQQAGTPNASVLVSWMALGT